MTRITNITIEIQVTIETISIEVEQTATTETIIIIDITIVLIDTDKDQIAITDIIQTITIEMIEEIRHIENKITDVNQKTEEQMETNITIITIKAE